MFCTNIVKKDPGRAKQSSLATAGTNFIKPGAQNKGDLCIKVMEALKVDRSKAASAKMRTFVQYTLAHIH